MGCASTETCPCRMTEADIVKVEERAARVPIYDFVMCELANGARDLAIALRAERAENARLVAELANVQSSTIDPLLTRCRKLTVDLDRAASEAGVLHARAEGGAVTVAPATSGFGVWAHGPGGKWDCKCRGVGSFWAGRNHQDTTICDRCGDKRPPEGEE